MIKIFKNLFTKKTFGTGAIIDNRPEEEKIKDYKFEEIVVSADPVNWIEKPQSEWRKFPIFNQNGSGSCVAKTIVKLLGIIYWLKNGSYVHFSATHLYQRRANKPASGMVGVDALNIAREGITLEELAPSQDMTDAQMDAVIIEKYKQDVGSVFKIGNFVILPIKDIDTIASIIQKTKKAVMVWYFFSSDEWIDQPKIINQNLELSAPATPRHSVAAVDYTLVNGKKCLIIEDSWGPKYGIGGRRIITEDFHKERNFFAVYIINFKFEEATIERPTYYFKKIMSLGESGEDIKALQNVLKYEGLFPANVESTGHYGSITAKAVYQFQIKYKIDNQDELARLSGRIAGPKTIIKLNELYLK